MKKKIKWVAIAIISIFCMTAFYILSCNGYFTKCNVYNGAVKINDEYYKGDLPIYRIEKELFISMEELATKLELTYNVKGNGTIRTLMMNEKEVATVQMLKGEKYISLHQLKNLSGEGIHISENILPYEGTIYIDNFAQQFSYDWTEHKYVMHALGAVEGYTLTNSLEAFLENYNAGCRVFEVDLNLTSDGKLVAVHDWSENTTCKALGMNIPVEKRGMPLTEEEYLDLKILGKYTTMSFEDVAELMDEYPDIYIVTDTKETEEEFFTKQFEVLVNTAKEVNPEILDRIIPQMYNEEMYYTIMNMYQWKSMIYTVYGFVNNDYSEKQVMDFAYQNGIRVVTAFESRVHELLVDELTNRNILLFMHTYNTEEEFARIQGMGADGVYTDFLQPTLGEDILE